MAAFGYGLGNLHGAEAARLTLDSSPLKKEVRAATSYSDVVKKVSPSVVNISTTRRVAMNQSLAPWLDDPFFRRFFGEQPDQRGKQPKTRRVSSLGSGVIVTADGYIVTNDHVVDSADEITVLIGKDSKEHKAKVVGRDSRTDVAVLKIDESGLSAITIGDSDSLEVGDAVLALGNPFGLTQTVTSGMVSALGRGNMGIEDYEDFIQTDAAINPGNSGGALVDAQGRLVGINTAILSRTGGSQGIGFAIPINMVRGVMDMLITDGRVSRGFLGVRPQDLDPALAKAFGLESTGGALVNEVTAGSAAEQAGIEVGDVVVEIDGKPITDARSLRLRVAGILPGTKVNVKLLRDGKERTVEVKLKEAPDRLASGDTTPKRDNENEVLKEVEVGDIDDAARAKYRIPEELKGALVVSVEPDSPAFEEGLREGNVLLEINRKPIKNAAAAVEATHGVTDKKILLRVWSEGVTHFMVIDESKP
jgi:serine protease Do